MLDTSKDNLTRELEAGEKLRDDKLHRFNNIVEQYVGGDASLDSEGEHSQWPENHTYEYLSLMIPRIAFDNPRVKARSRQEPSEVVLKKVQQMLADSVMGGSLSQQEAQDYLRKATGGKMAARAVEHGLNRWIRDTNYITVLDRVAYDYVIGYGVLMSSMCVMPGQDPHDSESRRWPCSDRISPLRYCKDPEALHGAEAKWKSHYSVFDMETLERVAKKSGKDSGWRLKEIQKLSKAGSGDSHKNDLNRNEAKVYTIWIPEYWDEKWPGGPQNGYHGALFLLGGVKNHRKNDWAYEFLRDPRPFWGPSWGPYREFGAYVEPDNPYPLSPIQAIYTQMWELNIHAQAMNRNAALYKRVVVVSDRNPKLAEDIKSKGDMYVIQIDDEQFEKKQVAEVEVAGISEKQLEHFEYFKDRLDRISGMSETMRGNVESGVTATADAIADDNSDVRVSYIQRKFAESVRMDLMTKAWYMMNEERVEFDLGPDAGESLGMLKPKFVGGTDESDDMLFEDLEIEIEAYSMPRTNQTIRQRQVMDAFNIIMQNGPNFVQMPYIDSRKMVRDLGDTLNIPNLEDVVNWEQLQAMSQKIQEREEEGGGVAGPAKPRPSGASRRSEKPGQSGGGKRGATSSARSRGQMAGSNNRR